MGNQLGAITDSFLLTASFRMNTEVTFTDTLKGYPSTVALDYTGSTHLVGFVRVVPYQEHVVPPAVYFQYQLWLVD
jgi:hypothetical protein